MDARIAAAAAADEAAFRRLEAELSKNQKENVMHFLNIEAKSDEQSRMLEQIYSMLMKQQSAASGAAPTPTGPTSSTEQWRLSYKCVEFERDEDGDRNKLGSGAFGTVYKGKIAGRSVAVKEFRAEILKIPKFKAMFCAELSILYKLSHPNIVELIAASDDYEGKARPFIAVELLSESLLKALYVANKLDDYDTKINVTRQLASAIEYLHACAPRIVHHDIKPENVMLTDRLVPKLIDFGLATTMTTLRATAASHGSQHNDIAGTPGFVVFASLEYQRYLTG